MDLRLVGFLTVFGLLITATHTYLYRRLVRDVTQRPRVRRLGRLLFIGLALTLLAGLVAARTLPRPAAVAAGYFAYTWMGLVMLMVPTLVVLDVLKGALHLGRRLRRDPAPADPARRALLAQGAAALTTLGAGTAGAVAFSGAHADPELVQVRVPIVDLPPALHGLRIAQLSDVHVGPTIGGELIEHLVRRVNALKPDVVALTGDFVDGGVAALGDFMKPLGQLESRHGSFFVTGNHEYYSGADAWIAWFEAQGIRVLRNERVELHHDGAVLDLLGIDDLRAFGPGHGPDLVRAAQGRDPKRPSVLLAHQPKAIFQAAELGLDLVLSGHTHGGQIWPASLVVRLVQPYVKGLHAHTDKTRIYVHSGSGYWGPPMRLKAPAEIALVTLERVEPSKS